MKTNLRPVLFVYGDGGHLTQARRLFAGMNGKRPFVFVTSTALSLDKRYPQYHVPELRRKYRSSFEALRSIAVFAHSVVAMIMIVFRHKPSGMISTGPGIAIVPALMMRIVGKPVVFLDSWSKVYYPSIASRIVYRLATLFFIQHREIGKFYPRALYRGRLG